MEQVTYLNNEAVQLFQKGRHQQAVQHLQEILAQMRVFLSSSQEEQEGASSYLQFVAEPLAVLPPRCNFIYNRLFKVSSIQVADKSNVSSSTTTSNTKVANGDSCNVFTACVIYNIAIIHHHLGLTKMTMDANAGLYFQKAKNLYQMCLRILEGTSSSGVVPGQDRVIDSSSIMMMTVHLLKAVSYNNLAQLYLDQKDGHSDEQARSCLLNLHNLVIILDEKRVNIDISTTVLFSEEDYDGIIENILLLQPPTMAAAA